MTDWTNLTKNLEERGFAVRTFATKEEAADYLDSQIDGVSVGFGGSMTVQEMGLYPRLAAHNNAVWHWDKAGLEQAAATEMVPLPPVKEAPPTMQAAMASLS